MQKREIKIASYIKPCEFQLVTYSDIKSYKMKCIVLLLCLIGYAWCESCLSSSSECRHTTCDNTSELHCVDGLCTCTTAHDVRCTTLQECLNVANWDCSQNRRHCIDNICRCARFTG